MHKTLAFKMEPSGIKKWLTQGRKESLRFDQCHIFQVTNGADRELGIKMHMMMMMASL